jgi:hypothetical protein
MALRTLQASTDMINVQCDKNLGPACTNIPRYIQLAFHPNDTSTYLFLAPQHAQKRWIERWKTNLTKPKLKFTCSALKDPETDPISMLYL